MVFRWHVSLHRCHHVPFSNTRTCSVCESQNVMHIVKRTHVHKMFCDGWDPRCIWKLRLPRWTEPVLFAFFPKVAACLLAALWHSNQSELQHRSLPVCLLSRTNRKKKKKQVIGDEEKHRSCILFMPAHFLTLRMSRFIFSRPRKETNSLLPLCWRRL